MHTESTTTDPRPFMNHMLLAYAWVRYNSARGNATERQALRTMQRLSAETLRRMLSDRNAVPQECR